MPLDPAQIFPLGIGTWGIGGLVERDNSIDEGKQTDALAYMFSNGMNFAEANMWYSQGYSAEILARGLARSNQKRESIFICQAIYLKENKDLKSSIKELDQVLELFGSDYIDSLQFSAGSFDIASFAEITEWIDLLLSKKKIRYTSITNEDLGLLKKYHQKYNDHLFSHEVAYNFEARVNEELGIIPYATEHNIKTVVYQPLRRNRTAQRNWSPLVHLASQYKKTQNQIILSWIHSKGYLALTKSETIAHIDEHLEAMQFEMKPEDLELLNSFHIPGYRHPEIDWHKTGAGVSIDQLSNIFDEEYDRQQSIIPSL